MNNTIDLMLEVDKGGANLVIMSLDIPGENAILSLRQIHKFYPQLPILILTAHEEIEYIKQCFIFGASGYVSKNSRNSEIVSTMKKVMFHDQYIDPNLPIAKIDLLTSFRSPYQQSYDKLSRREREVFPLAVLGCENKEIAKNVYISAPKPQRHIKHI